MAGSEWDSKPNFECAGAEGLKTTPADFGDEVLVRAALLESAKEAQKCKEDPRFDIGGHKFYNYCGTGDLVGDLDLFRRAIGAEKLNIYGYSYGTYVGITYGATFPHTTGRLVLNGVMDPTPDYTEQAKLQARAFAEISSHIIGLCQFDPDCAENLCKNPSSGVCNAPAETEEVLDTIVQGLRCMGTNPAAHFELNIGDYDKWKDLPSHIQDIYQASVNKMHAENCTQRVLTPADNKAGGPLTERFVFGVDFAGRYSVDWLKGLTLRLHRKYPYAGLARGWFYIKGSMNWPAIPSPAALSNADVPALLMANLYDPQTSVDAARHVRSLYPKSTMLSWQGGGHTVKVTHASNFDPAIDSRRECVKIITV